MASRAYPGGVPAPAKHKPPVETAIKYEGFTTFSTRQEEGILTVAFDFGLVNVQGQEMLAGLNSLAMSLERDRGTRIVVFQSANPEIRESGRIQFPSDNQVNQDIFAN